MTESLLKAFLNRELDVKSFVAQVSSEVTEYSLLLTKLGSSVNIIYKHNSELIFEDVHYQYLMSLLDSRQIEKAVIAYIFDAVLLSESVSDEALMGTLDDFVIDYDHTIKMR